jgi:hypothetical protein
VLCRTLDHAPGIAITQRHREGGLLFGTAPLELVK